MKISQEKGGSKNKLRYDVIYEINIMLLEIKNMSYKRGCNEKGLISQLLKSPKYQKRTVIFGSISPHITVFLV